MAVMREVDEIARSLVKHQLDNPPVRDLNRESDRRMRFPQKVADDLCRVVGSWTFVLIQVLFTGSWLLLNVIAQTNHWDRYPFLLLNLVITFENAVWVSLVLMALNRAAVRDRLRAQQDYEQQVKLEDQLRALISQLEAQDEVLLQVVQRLDRNDQELRRLVRRLGIGQERTG